MEKYQVYFESIDVMYPAYRLSEKEESKLEQQLNNILLTSDSETIEIIKRFHDHIVDFVGVVKYALGGQNFGGTRPQDTEIGISPIRANHLTLGTNATAYGGYIKIAFKNNWEVLASGSMDKDAGVIIFGIASASASPFIDGVKIQVGQRTLLPTDISYIKLKDNRNGIAVVPFSAVPILPEDTYTISLYSPDADDTNPPVDTIKLVGFTVGLGRFLNTKF